MAKVQKPAIHQFDEHVASVTASSDGAAISAPKGLVNVTTAASGVVYLADGGYNGQRCILYIASGSNDLTIKASDNSTSIKGYSTWDVSAEPIVICYWFHDGTNGYWYGVAGAA